MAVRIEIAGSQVVSDFESVTALVAVRIEIFSRFLLYSPSVVTALVAVRIEIRNFGFTEAKSSSPPLWR